MEPKKMIERHSHICQAELRFFVTVKQHQELLVSSEAGWLSHEMIVVTLNNQYYMLNLG